MSRQLNFQTISWFWDLRKHGNLDMDPPYQRRSVWPQAYKQYFIDTVLHNYPAPAIFLFRSVSPTGEFKYSVVDGKQRLTALFEFAEGQVVISRDADLPGLAGKRFSNLSADQKEQFWTYEFAVETLPTSREADLKNIFDRINRNTAKLTEQELRHAKFDGLFIKAAEKWADIMNETLPAGFPNIQAQPRRQMKDVELIADLFLLIEQGLRAYSQSELDDAFAERDSQWDKEGQVTRRFQDIVSLLNEVVRSDAGVALTKSRFRNLGDFFVLFAAVDRLMGRGVHFIVPEMANRLMRFANAVESSDKRKEIAQLQQYYEASRGAANDLGTRRDRILVLEGVLQGAMNEYL
ncbi:MAG TPA: DUF262 domain-containing protein [Terriglobales bacterium]|nr:DUF262 domain-containing protein [Terriglobales bacterium]